MTTPGPFLTLFLRAINTGSRRITNEELLAPLVDAGFTDVAAFQAAGNIVCRPTDSVRVELTEPAFTSLLSEAYGFDAPVFLRSELALRRIIERQPFTEDQLAATTGKTQVTFLAEAPTDAQIADVAALTPKEDLVTFDGLEWFWLPLDGVSGSKLPVPKIEQVLGPMTMRTVGTIERLVRKFA